MRSIKIVFVILIGFTFAVYTSAQYSPAKPVSTYLFTSEVINPAFNGSKDFTAVNWVSRMNGFGVNQVISMHSRLPGEEDQYKRFAAGARFSQEMMGPSRNLGASLSAAYHFSLDDQKLHHLSLGGALNGILSIAQPGDESTPIDTTIDIYAGSLDLGLYYYGPSAFIGVSGTNLFKSENKDSAYSGVAINLHRQIHMHAGYKFVLSKKQKIVLEPSILLSLNDTTMAESRTEFSPYLKLYVDNFYFGTSFQSLDFDFLSFFFMYQFETFHTGMFLKFPRNDFRNADNMTFEILLGLNLSRGGKSSSAIRHW